MTMEQQGITVNGKHSYRDFGLLISEGLIGPPEKFVATETVPFYNGYYDFSALAGAPTYTKRTLQYTFDLTADSQVELEALKNRVIDWLQPVHQEQIVDDTDPNYCYVGSCTNIEWTAEWLYGQLTTEFTCQPDRVLKSST